MSTTTLFGSTEAQTARDLIGGTAIGDLRNDLLKQILVATANRTGGSGGSGTVTSVSVTTQNGVSATVTNPTTTPALAFTLGAITPTTVQLSGSVSGTTLLQSPAIAGSAVITFPSVTGTLAITSNTVSQFAAGGTLSSLTGFSLRSTGAAFDLSLATSEVLTANRTLSFNVGNADRTLTIPATGTAALLGTANVFTAAQTVNAGTLTGAALTLSQTWNNAGATCRGVEVAVTDTNSASGSTLFRLLGGAAGTVQFLSLDKSGFFKTGNPSLFTHETENGAYIVKYNGTERTRITFAESAFNLQVMAGSVGDYGLVITNSSLNAGYLSSDIRLNNTIGVFKIEANQRQASGAYTGAGHTLQLLGGLAQITSTGGAGGLVDIRGGAAGGSGNNNGGNITLTGGAPTGSGTRGYIAIANNSADLLGFYAVTPVARQVLATGGGATVDNVITFLQTIGLCKQS